MKNNLIKFLGILLLVMAAPVHATDEVGHATTPKMLMYIQPIEYSNPITLWHPYREYWFYQGPVVERLAQSKLNQAYGEIGLCEGNQSGRLLVWVQPRMFYNPQVQLFYGNVTAKVYTGIGNLIGSYEGESKLHGYLDIKPEGWIEKSYAIAIDDMVAKMQADDAVQKLLGSKEQTVAANTTPCSMVTLLPTPKIRAMSF